MSEPAVSIAQRFAYRVGQEPEVGASELSSFGASGGGFRGDRNNSPAYR